MITIVEDDFFYSLPHLSLDDPIPKVLGFF